MRRETVLKLMGLSILALSIMSIAGYIESKIGVPVGNTTLLWVLSLIQLIIFYYGKKYYYHKNNDVNTKFIFALLVWNTICIVRGGFIADSYWDWKGLITNAFALLLPIVAYPASNSHVLQIMLRYYIKYAFPFFAIIFFVVDKNVYGLYLVPISFFIFFLPVLDTKWKIIIFTVSTFTLLSDLGARSTFIKFTLPFILLIVYWLRSHISRLYFNLLSTILFVTPIVFLYLAVNGLFNIFKMEEYIEGTYSLSQVTDTGEIVEEKLTADTRTPLYVEVLQTARKHDSWLIGRSPARGNETELFASISETTGRRERIGNEVAILNVFTWTGIIGVLLYFLIFFKAAFLGINRSNNIFSKMFGLFIAFRWLYAWVEDINTFSLSTLTLWSIIGLCYSKEFREMSNIQMKIWIRAVFKRRKYYKFTQTFISKP